MRKYGSLSLVFVVIGSAVLIFKWLNQYHLIIGSIAVFPLIPLLRWWMKRRRSPRPTIRINLADGFGYSLFRGFGYGIGVVVYLHYVFWVISFTPIYEIFYPCSKVMKRIDSVLDTRILPSVVKEIDKDLSQSYLSYNCSRQLARKKAYLLIQWAEEMESREKIEKLNDALNVAQEYDLKLEWELAEAKKRAVELEINPKKLPPGAHGAIRQVEASLYPLVIVYFSIDDSKGYPISDLVGKDIEVRENGILVSDFELSSFQRTPEPLNVVLCVDRSGSMKTALADAKEGARHFVNTLSPNDFVELIVFNDKVERQLGWSQDKGSLILLIERIEASGNTAIYRALALALEDLKSQNGNKSILLLTDGRDTSSQLSLNEILNQIKRMGVPVFVIGIKSSELDSKILKTIATETGGLYLEAANSSEVIQLYDQIAGKLKEIYRLVYQSKNSDEEELTVTIIAGAGNSIRIERMYKVQR